MSARFEMRVGTPRDTEDIANMMCIAGAGLFEQLLQNVVPGFSVDALLALAINDPDSPYHFENALIGDSGGVNAGLMLGFPAEDFVLPQAALELIPAARLAPLHEMLESRIDDSFYVHSLTVRPAFARRGLARLMLRAAAIVAAGEGHDRISLHVWRDNAAAMALYGDLGFEFCRDIDVPACEYLHHDGPVVLAAIATEALLDARTDD